MKTKITHPHLFFTVVSFLFLTACSQISSNEVDPSSVYGQISVSRDSGSTNVTVSGTFFVGGSTGTVINIDSPASVSINGSDANEISDPILNRTSYGGTFAVSVGSAALVYTDKNGIRYLNTVAFPGDFSISVPGAVSKGAGFTLSHSSTSPYLPGEAMEVTLQSASTSAWTRYAMVTSATSGSQLVSAADLSSLPTGALTISACRARSPAAQNPYPKGTDIFVRSCSNEITVTLQP